MDGPDIYVVSNSSAGAVSRPKFPYPLLSLSWLRADAARSSSSALEVVSLAEVDGRYVIRSSGKMKRFQGLSLEWSCHPLLFYAWPC